MVTVPNLQYIIQYFIYNLCVVSVLQDPSNANLHINSSVLSA
uniref:Uncharacterized protein n=1 Tax=Anguilla anguilla TaxID=7936 RepID=A0A0E9PWL8_ANGAN